MDSAVRMTVLDLLRRHRIMTVATNRADGWPQATTVGYASDGLTLYFFCAADSQKAANITRDNRISLTIDSDTKDPMAITGLSMAALTAQVTDPREVERVIGLMAEKYPEYKDMVSAADMSRMMVVRVVPEVISILDYSKGFGHSDLVRINRSDLRAAA
jgi:PPOX class probable F420-dependent enzyme